MISQEEFEMALHWFCMEISVPVNLIVEGHQAQTYIKIIMVLLIIKLLWVHQKSSLIYVSINGMNGPTIATIALSPRIEKN